MNLIKILENVSHIKQKDFNPEISFLTSNSNNVKKDSVFVCLKGANFDGHDFAKKAISAGASVVVVEKDLHLSNQVLVKNTHEAYAKMCANLYENPAKNLKFIGVTGTNGKTSVSKIIKDLLTKQGIKTGLIGTIQNEIGQEVFKTNYTTPNALEFQQLIKKMSEKNCEYVVMEVSSHALVQHRIADTKFEIAIFTNLSQDHLDYHKTMNSYFEAKKLLFKRCKKAIICVDDSYGEQLIEQIKCPKYSYAIENKDANFIAKNFKVSCEGVEYILEHSSFKENVYFKTPGIFSIYNSMAAFICCKLLGFSPEKIAKSLKTSPPIKGRSEIISTKNGFTIICDYAHSPDGLQNILNSVNSYKKKRVVTLFGCGGDRDKTKRPIMGEIAARNSDFLIITSDNPRTEEPSKIIEDIIVGVRKTKTPYVKIVNRKKAIFYAVKNAKKDDILILAGKGHETYQVIGKDKIDFDEREIVKEAFKELYSKNLKK